MSEHWEVVYETGAMSVVNPGDNPDDAKAALKAHHQRALTGQPGQLQSSSSPHSSTGEYRPQTHPAERIKHIFVYDDHPANLTPPNLPADQVRSLLKDHTDASVVDVAAFQAALLEATKPISTDVRPHDSKYRADAREELDLAFLED